MFESALGRGARPTSRACASPTCSTPPSTARSRASTSRARTSCSPIPTPSMSPPGWRHGMRGRAGSFPQRDRELRACLPARLTFLEKDGTFTNAERRIQRVRKVMTPQERLWRTGRSRCCSPRPSASACITASRRDHGRDRAHSRRASPASPSRGSTSSARSSGLATTKAPEGTPVMHIGGFVRGKGRFMITEYVADRREDRAALPAAADHRPHPQPVQCRRADPAHRERRLARGRSARNPSARRGTARGARWRLGAPGQPRRRDDAARRRSPTGWRRAWSIRPSITR